MKLNSNWKTKTYKYSAFSLLDENKYVFDGNGFEINGDDKVVHILTIHNCKNCIVKNVNFIRGNTEALKNIKRENIPYRKEKQSVFEIIDGGAVVITGNSNVAFEKCKFIDNKSIMCGGAISNQSKGVIIFKSCYFENSIAGHTGSAIDNLTKDSNVEIINCKFKNNISNTWHQYGYPHGQISLFPYTKATISNSEFIEGSIPFDYYSTSKVILDNNKYLDYKEWKEDHIILRKGSIIIDNIKMFSKMYWVLPKIFGNVIFRINV
ncbi:hypothetical protein H6762_04870 [Candidatus Nomurabacteria bacterium]|nr:hypothetical protein [Candidatus Nomurabacteria bacterium]